MSKHYCAVALALLPCAALAQSYKIATLAGGGLPVNIPATAAYLPNPIGIAVDSIGNVYFTSFHSVLRIDAATSNLTFFAGNGSSGFSGDDGPATSAQLNNPHGLTFDAAGNLYIADSDNNRIRMVSKGTITTIAGGGSSLGDNGPPASAILKNPVSVTFDHAGNLYIADNGNNRIRLISNNIISTVAGVGAPGEGSGGLRATLTALNSPQSVAVDSADSIYISDSGNNRIVKVVGGIATVYLSDGNSIFGPTIIAPIQSPGTILFDNTGAFFVLDTGNSRVAKVANNVVTTVAGVGKAGYGGDGGPPLSAQLNMPLGLTFDAKGYLYIADSGNGRVRRISAGTINTIAGGNATVPENIAALSAQILSPLGLTSDSSGDLYFSDSGTGRVRKISHGIVSTVAGGGATLGDGGLPINAQLVGPEDLLFDRSGDLYISDPPGFRVRRITNGVINTIAGNGVAGYAGDGGTATSAELYFPRGLALESNGSLDIADENNCRIRRVSNFNINLLAGNGTVGFAGDGGPPVSAELYGPAGVALDGSGNLFITDTGNRRIRKISGNTISTIAGGGVVFTTSAPALSAQLSLPWGLVFDGSGNLFFTDYGDHRVRRLANGVVTVIAGTGVAGYSGDNGAAASAALNYPTGIAIDSAGNLYVADTGNGHIRILTPNPCVYSLTAAPLSVGFAGGKVNVQIQSDSGCPWTVSNLPSWITLSGAATGVAPGSVSLSVAANTGPARTAQITIAGQTLNLSQSGLQIDPAGLVNSAAFTSGISPGSIATVSGTFLLPGPGYGSLPLHTTLNGLSFQFNGSTAAPIFSANSTTANIQIPWELTGQTQATLAVTLNGQTAPPVNLTIAPYSPGIFPGAILDSHYNHISLTNPAIAGISVIQIFCTGLGPVSNQPATGALSPTNPPALTTTVPTVTVGGAPAEVLFSGLTPGDVGLYQVNVLIPVGAPTETAVPIVISIGGITAIPTAIPIARIVLSN